jgi:L-seryl-tRNA(Ser) seleniumtransferase
MIPNPLRRLPSVHDLLESPALRALAQRIHRNAVVSTIRTVLDEVRQEFQTAASDRSLPNLSELADRIVRRVAERPCRAVPSAINATGTVLHAGLGPPPLAEEAIAEMAAAARNYGGFGDRENAAGGQIVTAVEELLYELTGAEAAFVAGGVDGAEMLALSALAAGREVLVSRGQLNQADGCRLPEIARLAGASLTAVGNAEWAALDDYSAAINERTAAMLLGEKVVKSNFPERPEGGAEIGPAPPSPPVDESAAGKTASLAELIELCRGRSLPVIHDLGAGGLMGFPEIKLPGQPTAQESVRAGADLVLMRGDMLLGGPSCGILLGRKPVVEQIARAAMAQVLRPTKLSLAALAATLRLYREPDKARLGIPVLRLLTTSAENLRNRAQRLAPQAAAIAAVAEAKAVAEVAYLRGEPSEAAKLPTWCVAIRPASGSVERLVESLRAGAPPVFGRPSEDRLLLDLRSVLPRQDLELIDALDALV